MDNKLKKMIAQAQGKKPKIRRWCAWNEELGIFVTVFLPFQDHQERIRKWRNRQSWYKKLMWRAYRASFVSSRDCGGHLADTLLAVIIQFITDQHL